MDHVRRAVVDRLKFRKLDGPASLLAALFALWPAGARGEGSVESAIGRYSETALDATVFSLTTTAGTPNLVGGEGHRTNATFGYTGERIHFKAPGNLLAGELGGKDTIDQHSLTAAVDQGLAVGTQAGLLIGSSKSLLSDTRFAGLKLGHWWRAETLQTVLEARHTIVKEPSLQFTDTDGKRIRTPTDLNGNNLTLNVTHLTTPTTILRGSLSGTERSDRPPAGSESAEIRQFVTPANAAVLVAVTHYENVGQIDDTQQFGTIVANNARFEWNQRLLVHAILMGGYRYYLEEEKPRALDADRKQIGTDALYGSFRWRFTSAAAWTDDAPEAYLFFSRYNTNAPTLGSVVGFGGRWIW